MRRAWWVTGLFGVLGLVAACSSSGSAAPEPATTAVPTTTSAVPAKDVELQFVRALTSHTPEGSTAAAAATVPGSPAALYVEFERLWDGARRDAGQALDVENVQRQDERVIMSAPLIEMYRAFMDFEFEGDLITSFSVASSPIDGRVVGQGGSEVVDGDTYEVAGARISPRGSVEVVVRITGGSPGTVVPSEATLVTTAGRVASDGSVVVPVIQTSPGEDTLVYYEFLQASDAISLTLRVCGQQEGGCRDVDLPFLSTRTA